MGRWSRTGFGPNQGGHMMRHQDRGRSGRWQRNATLGADVCQNEECRAFILPEPGGGGLPDTCHRCGQFQVRDTCMHGYQRFPMPPFTECGCRAVACDVATGEPRCAEHAQGTGDA
jgi:hypothetical protein